MNTDNLFNHLKKISTENNWTEEKKERIFFGFKFWLDIVKNIKNLAEENPDSKPFIKSLILELYDIKRPIKHLSTNHPQKDKSIILNTYEIFLSQPENDTLFLKYGSFLDNEKLGLIAKSVFQYFDNISINLHKIPDTDDVENFFLLNTIGNDSIISMLLNIKLYLLEEMPDSIFQMLLQSNEKGIRNKTILAKDIINHLKKGLNDEKIIQPLNHFFPPKYSFVLSKKSADIFINKEIKILNNLLLLWESETISFSEKKRPDDLRIDTDLSSEIIVEYFMKLNKEHNGKELLTKTEISNFICANFARFPEKERKILNPDIPKGNLIYFIYEFYGMARSKSPLHYQKEFCELLIKNFKDFEGYKLEDLTKKLSRPKPKNYIL